MSENDLPRYTWFAGSMTIKIIKRIGLYGNEEVGTWCPPPRNLNGQDKAIANAICEFLTDRDREKESS